MDEKTTFEVILAMLVVGLLCGALLGRCASRHEHASEACGACAGADAPKGRQQGDVCGAFTCTAGGWR
jgi:hypothetical protein